MSKNQVHPKIVSQTEWLAARKELLAKEKELTRQRDVISAQRRELRWVKVEKNYVFDGPNGKQSLADLFGDKNQLIVYHLMFGPEWKEACPSCSFIMDHTDGALVHLAQRDVAFAAISRAPFGKIEAFKKRMGWRFPWVSSNGNDFNFDYHVSFTKEEKAKGKVYYNFDMTNSGRSARKLLESASSTKTRTATSSTPIPLTRAGPRPVAAPTTGLTSSQRDVTKTTWPLPCPGSAITTAMRKVAWRIPRGPTGPRKPRQDPKRQRGRPKEKRGKASA
jgi:predicted dithiol-disulfide oxidoreductase (DUF899 family)